MMSTLYPLLVTLALVLGGQNPASAQPAPPQNPIVKEAQQLATAGNFAEALQVYQKGLAADPKSAELQLGAGRMLDMLGRHEEARQQLAKAIELAGPDLKDQAQTAMAVSYAFESKAAEAAKFLDPVFNERVAARNHTGAAGTANALGRIYLESGDLSNAASWYLKGLSASKNAANLTPAQSDLWQMRWIHSEGRIAARRGNFEAAKAEAARMKELLDKGENENERPQYHYLVGYIALESGDADTAIGELQKANLSDAFILGLIARAYEKKGDAARAAEYHQKALAAGTAHSINTAFSRQWARKYLKK